MYVDGVEWDVKKSDVTKSSKSKTITGHEFKAMLENFILAVNNVTSNIKAKIRK